MTAPLPIDQAVRAGIDTGLAYLRKVDPEAAADLDALRRREVTRPRVVVVGETKRGKSSLVNMLLGAPGLSPVDAGVATATYLEVSHASTPTAHAYVPGWPDPIAVDVSELADWATVGGRLPDGARLPRRIDVGHPAPLLRYLTLVDTPGTGGLDPRHADVALDAAESATALLFVVDASAPFAASELAFLVQATTRVNVVVFALTKVDAYPGWRTILADNRAQLQAHAPRFGSASWFPVSARLAELAVSGDPATARELLTESRVPPLQQTLIELAGHGHLLRQANVLRAVRSELVRLDGQASARIAATDPGPAAVAKAREDRAAVAARKRTETRQWSLTLSAETQRARVEATALLRTSVAQLQQEYLDRIDRSSSEAIKELPVDVDQALQALSVRLSHDLEARFRQVGERVLAQVFGSDEVRHVLRQLNAGLRHALATRPPRDGVPGDNALIVMSSVGMAMMAGRGAAFSASVLGLGAVAGAGLVVPVVGVGLGLAAGAFMVWKRRSMNDRQQARTWLREVLGEARAALTDEILHRFTDLQYALTLALDEAIERRLHQLDADLAAMDQAAADDRAARARRKAALAQERETLRARVGSIDEVLVRVRRALPAGPTDGQG